MARVGRLIVTAAILGTGPGFALFDLNRTHIFKPPVDALLHRGGAAGGRG
jgi:hypothetical protein